MLYTEIKDTQGLKAGRKNSCLEPLKGNKIKSLNYSTFSLKVLNDEQNESKHKKHVIVKNHLEIIPKVILWL